MANPNLLEISSVIGKTAVNADIPATPTVLLSNGAASNKVFKVNSLKITNIDGVNDAEITVDLYRSGVAYEIAHNILVPAKASLVVITKDDMLYLEEADDLRITASATGDLSAVCSYDEIT